MKIPMNLSFFFFFNEQLEITYYLGKLSYFHCLQFQSSEKRVIVSK